MNAIDLLDASDEVKAALRRRRTPTLSLKPTPVPGTFTERQRRVLRVLRRLKTRPARFHDFPLTIGDRVLKSLVDRGMIDVQITLTGNGQVQAHLLAQDEK